MLDVIICQKHEVNVISQNQLVGVRNAVLKNETNEEKKSICVFWRF